MAEQGKLEEVMWGCCWVCSGRASGAREQVGRAMGKELVRFSGLVE
jgi:hypothetical protein